jgi:hypothetical protein
MLFEILSRLPQLNAPFDQDGHFVLAKYYVHNLQTLPLNIRATIVYAKQGAGRIDIEVSPKSAQAIESTPEHVLSLLSLLSLFCLLPRILLSLLLFSFFNPDQSLLVDLQLRVHFPKSVNNVMVTPSAGGWSFQEVPVGSTVSSLSSLPTICDRSPRP